MKEYIVLNEYKAEFPELHYKATKKYTSLKEARAYAKNCHNMTIFKCYCGGVWFSKLKTKNFKKRG